MKPWIVKIPHRVEKTLRKLPREIEVFLSRLIRDFEGEGPFPKDWQIGRLSGSYEGFLKVRLRKDYRVVYRYESQDSMIFVEKVGHRKDVYRSLI